jgi:hypothetical protein
MIQINAINPAYMSHNTARTESAGDVEVQIKGKLQATRDVGKLR